MRIKSTATLLMLTALVIVGGTVPAFADLSYGYTIVNSATYPEKNHAEILHDIYNQNFTPSGEDYLGDAGVSAYRVYDFDDLEVSLHVVYGNQNDVDQIWTDGTAMVHAEAKYAGMTQSFGWNEGGLGHNYVELLTKVGDAALVPIPAGDFLWGYKPNSEEWWSDDLSLGGEDHMVTYFLTGDSLYGETVWLIFMEDMPFASSDQDYNDFVVEIRALPEPATVLLLGLGGLLLRRRKRA